jgi:hypothetical protein
MSPLEINPGNIFSREANRALVTQTFSALHFHIYFQGETVIEKYLHEINNSDGPKFIIL